MKKLNKKQLERRVRSLERTLKSEKETLEAVLVSMTKLAEESTAVILDLANGDLKAVRSSLSKNSCKMIKVVTLGKSEKKSLWGLEVSN